MQKLTRFEWLIVAVVVLIIAAATSDVLYPPTASFQIPCNSNGGK